MYVHFSELPPSQKKLRKAYEFSKEKSGSEKEEKNHFFCKLDIKNQCFLHNIYIQWQKKYLHIHKKMLNEKKKKNVHAFLMLD